MNPIDPLAVVVALLAAVAVERHTASATIGRHPLAPIALFLVPLAILGQGLVLMRLRREFVRAPAATLTA